MRAPALTQLRHGLAAGLAALLLGGCGLPRMIDSEVESFVGTPAAVTGARYRFERLPSQQAQGGAAQDQIQALAEAALDRAGLVRDDAQARYSVQIAVKVLQFQPEPRRKPHFGIAVRAADGTLYYPAPLLVLEPPWYSHTVHFLLRDIASAQIAYETSARFDGPWSDSANLLPAIMDAALRDYPNPPQGLHKVVIELPPRSTER